MENSVDPTLITYKHEGAESAQKVIAELKKRNLKKGDLVALEVSEKQLSILINEYLGKLMGHAPKHPDIAERVFMEKVFDYLMKVDVNVFPFGSKRVEDRVVDLVKKYEESGKKPTRKEKRLLRFLMFPIRERFFGKRLRGKNPKFVLGGSLHLPALKKAFQYREVVDTGKPPLKLRLYASKSRLQYRTAKKISATKRNLAKKRRK